MAVKSKRRRIDYWQSANQIMVIFGVGLSFGIYGPSLIDLAEIYSSTPKAVALMNSARALGTFVGSCVGGFFYKYINDQILMIVTLIIYAFTTALIPILPSITYLYVLGFVAGASIGISHIGSQVRLVKIWAERSASAIQAFHSAFGVGAMIGPFLGAPFLGERENGIILKETKLYFPYAGFGIVFLSIAVSMIAAYCVEPSGIEKAGKGGGNVETPRNKTLELTLMGLLFLYLMICVNIEDAFSTLISIFAVGDPDLHFSKPEAAYLAGVFWTAFTAGRIISIFLAAFFDIKQLLTISHIFVVCASGIMIIFHGFAPCTWLGAAIMGLGLSSMYGAICGLVLQYFHVRHVHISVIVTASCFGMALSAYFVPPVVQTWPRFLMYYTGTAGIIHLCILFVMFLAVRGKQTINTRAQERPQATPKDTNVA